jgi:MFS family permease
MNPTSQVAERIDSVVGGPARRQAVAVLGAVLAIDGADKAAVGGSAADLERSLGIGHTELGLLVSLTLLATAVTTLPMGLLVDRVRRVPLLTTAVVGWSAVIVVSGTSGSLGTLLVSRLSLGALLGVAGPAVGSLVGDLIPARERGRVYGYIVAGELFGAAIGILVAGELTALLSWRFAFWFLGAAGLSVAWALWRLLPEPARGGQSHLEPGAREIPAAGDGARRAARGRPGAGRTAPAASGGDEPGAEREDVLAGQIARDDVRPDDGLVLRDDPARMPLWEAVAYVLRIRTTRIVVLASALGFFFFAGVRTFAVVFVRGHYGLSQATASAAVVVLGLGSLGGVLAGGRLADRLLAGGRFDARIVVAAVAYVAAAVAFVPAVLLTTLTAAAPLYVLAAAGFAAPNAPLDAARLDVMHSRLWGRAESVRTVLRTLGEAAAPISFGFAATQLGPSSVSGLGAGGNARAVGPEASQGLEYAFLAMIAALVLAGLVLLRARSTYPRDVATARTSEAATRRSTGQG